MATIIYIETSTVLCSTALSRDGEIIATRSDDGRRHASLTAPFVKEMLDASLAVLPYLKNLIS